MAEPGWYPDPAGAPGRLRYWDGQVWAADTVAAPSSAAPAADPSAPIRVTGQPDDAPVPEASAWQRFKGPVVIVGIALVTILAMIWGLSQLGIIGGDKSAASNPTEFCPPSGPGNFSVDPHPNDGRVHGGALSFPRLGPPWSPPQVDGRVPFGRDVQSQEITIEQDYQPGRNWVASVLVGELVDGDGFASPRAAMDMVARCIVGAFYGDSPVQREDVGAHSLTVDGHEAYLLELHLSFDVKGLQAKGETALIVIVASGTSTKSIYYASIPDNASEYLPVARELVGRLRVSG